MDSLSDQIMEKPSATKPAQDPDPRDEGRSSWIGRIKAWSRYDEREDVPPPGRPWPLWACWLVSALLLFHMTAILACELADQAVASKLATDLGRRFWAYVVLINQDYPHAYFAPNPETMTPVVTARLRFKGGGPYREVRLPDRSARPRIRHMRQIALAWHLTHEWNEAETPRRSYWAASYAQHLCRTNPGCNRVTLLLQMHAAPQPGAVVDAVARGKVPDFDSEDWYSFLELIGEFACDDF